MTVTELLAMAREQGIAIEEESKPALKVVKGGKPTAVKAALSDAAKALKANAQEAIDPQAFIVAYVEDPFNRTKKDKKTGVVTTYAGVHTVFGSFTKDFLALFPNYTAQELYALTDDMNENGLITKKAVRGGYMLFPAGSAPTKAEKAEKAISPTLARMLEKLAKQG